MDLETELQRLLHTRDVPLALPDPVPAVHAGMRRRRRNQRLQAATSALAVIAVVLGGSVVVTDHLGAHTRPPTAVQPVAIDPAAVPPGFQALDVSSSDPSTAWVLGSARCSSGVGYCPTLLTSTGGSPWERRTPPPAVLKGGDGQFAGDCTAVTCVSHLRFVTTDKGQIGYAYGPGLSISLDGGVTWKDQAVRGQVLALEATSRSVVRVVTSLSACPCLGLTVERSTPDATRWVPVHAINRNLISASLVRRDNRLLVLARQHTAGGAGDALSTVLLSNNSGDTWVERDDPCGPGETGDESDATQMSLAANGVVVALCENRVTIDSFTRVSTDSGKTYEKVRPLPGPASLIAAVGDAIVVAVDDGNNRRRLVRSTDRGRHWTSVATQASDPRYPSEYLSFTTDKLGTWVGGDRRRLVRTADAGATWVDQPLSR